MREAVQVIDGLLRGQRVTFDGDYYHLEEAPFVPLPSQYLLGGAFQLTLRGGSQLVIQR